MCWIGMSDLILTKPTDVANINCLTCFTNVARRAKKLVTETETNSTYCTVCGDKQHWTCFQQKDSLRHELSSSLCSGHAYFATFLLVDFLTCYIIKPSKLSKTRSFNSFLTNVTRLWSQDLFGGWPRQAMSIYVKLGKARSSYVKLCQPALSKTLPSSSFRTRMAGHAWFPWYFHSLFSFSVTFS